MLLATYYIHLSSEQPIHHYNHSKPIPTIKYGILNILAYLLVFQFPGRDNPIWHKLTWVFESGEWVYLMKMIGNEIIIII